MSEELLTVTTWIKKCNPNIHRYLFRSEFGDNYTLYNSTGELIFDVYGYDGKLIALHNSHYQGNKLIPRDIIESYKRLKTVSQGSKPY